MMVESEHVNEDVLVDEETATSDLPEIAENTTD